MESNSTISWSDLNLSPEMMKLIEEAGYKSPSAVQAKTIPLAMEGKDVLVSSQTGSGKTASFVIPIVEKFKGKNGTYVLALSPTREIAQQTGAIFESFGKPFGLKVCVCIGGADIPTEKAALAQSPHIIVATPGRLCDHLERGNVWLDFIQCLVFDEADRMLEMGFSKQIDLITEQIHKSRQTLMLSATFAPAVEKLARKAMNNPEQVIIEKTVQSAPKIDQMLYWLPEDRKLSKLVQIVKEEKGTFFVFVNSKEKTFQLSRLLNHRGVEDVTYIHSDLQQEHRELAVAEFKSGKYRIIIATDVMGRGIDVDDVAHVVNYDVPKEAADYVHRIGRTGRRGLTGHASTFAIPGKDDKAIAAIGRLRGVDAPEKPKPVEARDNRGPRFSDNRNEGPRNDRPRDDRPRNDRPRDDRPRNERPRNDRPQHAPKVQKDAAPKAAPEMKSAPVVDQKKTGFMDKIKSIFGFTKK
jgi:superfamily II DNA/RNA helicase